MTRLRRDRLIRWVLVIGALTAISTSSVPPFEREGRTTLSFAVGETHHVTVRANEAAHRPAEGFVVSFTALLVTDPPPEARLLITPDLQALGEPKLLGKTGGRSPCTNCTAGGAAARPLPGDEDAGGELPRAQAGSPALPPSVLFHADSASFEVPRDQCPSRGDCVIGFNIERIDQTVGRGDAMTLEARAEVRRAPDSSFVCAADRDFDASARVEVTPQ